LRLGIELAHALDVVTDELESERTGVSGREDVEDAATERQIAGIWTSGTGDDPTDQPLGEGVGATSRPRRRGDRRGEPGAGQAALRAPRRSSRSPDAGLQEVVEALARAARSRAGYSGSNGGPHPGR
jgi:hypothetical protein